MEKITYEEITKTFSFEDKEIEEVNDDNIITTWRNANFFKQLIMKLRLKGNKKQLLRIFLILINLKNLDMCSQIDLTFPLFISKNGFSYKYNQHNSRKIYYVCSEKNCKAKLAINISEKEVININCIL
jgi:hypothetical protein